jgi:mono/diheme cytochrome c family protein
MSFVHRNAVPFAAGLAAATAAFGVIALTTGDGGEGRAPAGGEAAQRADGLGASADGLAVFNRLGCGGCHRLAAAHSSGPVAPNLDAELPGHTRVSLRAAILSPPPLSMMPQDFGERMTEAELEALIDFLLASR